MTRKIKRNPEVGNDPINSWDPFGMQEAPLNPVGGNVGDVGQPRGCDGQGCGGFGAARGARNHNGLDLLVPPNTTVRAPISGSIRVITAIYPNDNPDFDGVEITNDVDNQTIKIFYVDPSVATGDVVGRGDVIGTAQDRAATDPGMQNHVHLQVERNGTIVDPEPIVTPQDRNTAPEDIPPQWPDRPYATDIPF